MTGENVGAYFAVPDAADWSRRAKETLVDQALGKTDRLEDLGPAVAEKRADAHFAHNLEQTLFNCAAVVA